MALQALQLNQLSGKLLDKALQAQKSGNELLAQGKSAAASTEFGKGLGYNEAVSELTKLFTAQYTEIKSLCSEFL